MSEFIVRDTNRETERPCDSMAEAEETKDDMVALGATPEDIEIETPEDAGGESNANTPQPSPMVDVDESNLPDEPPVDTDPLEWIPSEFQDTIDGSIAINRKGFEVLAHHYNISCETDMVENSDETVIHKAEARTDDGTIYTAYGEAHSAEDKDTQLVRLSDTRAFKRAVSRATGIGMVAVSEIKNEL